MSKWTHERIGNQQGKVVIITGANSGIGFAAACALARAGARVVLACRSRVRGEAAVAKIRDAQTDAEVELAELDLADLDSVRAFAESFLEGHDRLDLLINNAGVMIPPESKTKQGFELQFGVNHLGHFALTGLLLARLRATPGARVVNVSSVAHRMGAMDFDDLNFERRGYSATQAYGQSKLANLLFTFELQRRLEAAGSSALAVAAHPGWTATNLQQHAWYVRVLNPVFGMSIDKGALPTLRAAVDPGARGGEYFGPGGLLEVSGYPKRAFVAKTAKSREDAARLWEISERLTGVRYELAPSSAAA